MAEPSELAMMEPLELGDRLAESRRELFNLRFQLATGQLDNTARLGHVRKEIARLLTYLRQHDLGIVVAPPAVAEAGAARGGRRRRAAAGAADRGEEAGAAGRGEETGAAGRGEETGAAGLGEETGTAGLGEETGAAGDDPEDREET